MTQLPKAQNLSLAEQIGQMIVVRASGYLFDHQIRYPVWEAPAATLQHWIKDVKVGGVILLGGSAAEMNLRSRQLQDWAEIPLLIAADIEEGVGQRFSGATHFPPPMALEALESDAEAYAYKMGEVTAQEALAIGINWILAPVVDVNNNPDNPVINVRSFGESAAKVSRLASAFIKGAQQYPALTTAKHFPGHGDTQSDSHLDLPVIPHSQERLSEIEIPPFASAIAAGVDSVMSAHLLIPAWDEKRPATLSPKILTHQLRQRLGFEGLVVTDALVMGGVAKFASPEEVAVMAVEAGADILLMPQDPVIAIEAVLNAVESGRISPERIAASVQRIFKAKQKVTQGNQVSESAYGFISQLAQPGAMKAAQEIIERSLQIGGDLPLSIPSENTPRRNLIVVDDAVACDFIERHVPAVTFPQQLGYTTQLIDSHTLSNASESFGRDSLPTLLQVFIRGNPFRGSASFPPSTQAWFKDFLKNTEIQGIILYGSPYTLDWFQPLFSPSLPWVFSYAQMPLAQEITLQKLFDLSRFGDLKPKAFI